MTNDVATQIGRIDRALARIERAAAASRPSQGDSGEADARYEALRARTQAALAELDGVISRVAQGGHG